jgi:hypothetical protein
MLLVWMPVFDLVRTRGPGVVITIDGRAVTTGRLPMAWLHGRRLVKYASDLVVVRINPAQDGTAPVVEPDAATHLELAAVDGQPGIAELATTALAHTARLVLDPPFPDPARLADGASAVGSWRLGIDQQATVVGGTWHAQRTAGRVAIVIDSTARWHPGPLPLLMRVVTRVVPTFRAWPTTYRWSARVTLGHTPTITSAWERKGAVGAQAYRRMMHT